MAGGQLIGDIHTAESFPDSVMQSNSAPGGSARRPRELPSPARQPAHGPDQPEVEHRVCDLNPPARLEIRQQLDPPGVIRSVMHPTVDVDILDPRALGGVVGTLAQGVQEGVRIEPLGTNFDRRPGSPSRSSAACRSSASSRRSAWSRAARSSRSRTGGDERRQLLVGGVQELDLVAVLVEAAQDAVDAVAGIAVHPPDAMPVQAPDDMRADRLGRVSRRACGPRRPAARRAGQRARPPSARAGARPRRSSCPR
jgi:hypothetical protein